MSGMPGGGRQAAHVLLDAVSVWSTDASDATNAQAAQLAIQRLNDVDAVIATLSDDDELHVDISNLVGGVMVTMKFLVRQLALARSIDEHEVIANTREFLDDVGRAQHRP